MKPLDPKELDALSSLGHRPLEKLKREYEEKIKQIEERIESRRARAIGEFFSELFALEERLGVYLCEEDHSPEGLSLRVKFEPPDMSKFGAFKASPDLESFPILRHRVIRYRNGGGVS